MPIALLTLESNYVEINKAEYQKKAEKFETHKSKCFNFTNSK